MDNNIEQEAREYAAAIEAQVEFFQRLEEGEDHLRDHSTRSANVTIAARQVSAVANGVLRTLCGPSTYFGYQAGVRAERARIEKELARHG